MQATVMYGLHQVFSYWLSGRAAVGQLPGIRVILEFQCENREFVAKLVEPGNAPRCPVGRQAPCRRLAYAHGIGG